MNVLWDDLTGAEHLYFFGRLKGLTGSALKDAVKTGLENVRLWPARNKLSKKYSGGMKRRLAVAISLIGDPKVVFLDEPRYLLVTSELRMITMYAALDLIPRHDRRCGSAFVLLRLVRQWCSPRTLWRYGCDQGVAAALVSSSTWRH